MMSQKKRITFFLVNLYRGGGERVSLDLIRGFLEAGYTVDLILMKREGPYLEQVPEGVEVIVFDTKRILGLLPKLVRYLREQKPQALISIIRHMHLVSLWAKMIARVPTKIIMRVGIPYSVPNTKSNTREWLLPFLSRLFYKKADAVVAVSKDIAADLKTRLDIPTERIHAIYNPKFLDEIREKAQESVDEPWLTEKDVPTVVAMGRLAPQKGFDVLIKACALASKEIPVRLLILGEGGEEKRLFDLAEKEGFAESLKILPFKQNPYTFLAKGDVFTLSSRWEGMPNALIEAMACDVPVIATDCVSGPREILGTDSEYGMLVPAEDVGAFAEALIRMLSEGTLREEYRKKAHERAQAFSHERIIAQYVDLIEAS